MRIASLFMESNLIGTRPAAVFLDQVLDLLFSWDFDGVVEPRKPRMGTEIERKFLVRSWDWQKHATGSVSIRQGYIALGDPATVRVRIIGFDAVLTVKGKTAGMSRSEFEYPIPVADAERMLHELSVGGEILKTRYTVLHGNRNRVWEVDVFGGLFKGLVLAEVELDSEDDPVTMPDWVDIEVTADPMFRNSEMAAAALRATHRPPHFSPLIEYPEIERLKRFLTGDPPAGG